MHLIDEYVQEYIFEAINNPLISEEELRDILDAYNIDDNLIDDLKLLNNVNKQVNSIQNIRAINDIDTAHDNDNENKNVNEKSQDLDPEVKKNIINKYFAGTENATNNMVLPRYLREKTNEKNKIRYRDGMIASHKGEKYVSV